MEGQPMTDSADRQVSPQERGKCACPSWSTARDCIRRRYDEPLSDEECECLCHSEYDESDHADLSDDDEI